MRHFLRHRKIAGFTLVEVMLVAAILALTASIAIPNHFRARKRAQASRLLDDLRTLDQALDQYCVENRCFGNETLTLTGLLALQKYLKKDSLLYSSLPNDMTGRAFVVSTVSQPPKISTGTFNEFSEVAPLEFWSPYYP